MTTKAYCVVILAGVCTGACGNKVLPLAPSNPSPALAFSTAGAYEMTLTADPACSQLPAELRTRAYQTIVEPRGDYADHWFTITLGGADFYPTQRVMSGRLQGGGARFTVASQEAFEAWLDDLPVVEQVGPTAYLALHGTAYAATAPADAPVTAVFSGSFSYCPTGGDSLVSFTCRVAPVECQSTQHALTLSPRRTTAGR